MAETESEFQGYTGDCVWAAVHMGAHRLAPSAWPVPSAAILNRLTSEAIAAGIGVGARGEATPGQLKTMLERWGMRYTPVYDYNGVTIPAAQLAGLLDGALARGKPVLLGFTNGQALTGDEVGLHGHEIVVLHPATPDGYPSGDGDNPKCAAGGLVYYPLAMLEAAAPDSAYVLEEVPGMASVDVTGLGAGFAEYAQQHGLTGPHTPEVHMQGWSWAAWEQGTVLTYAQGQGVKDQNAPGMPGWALYHLAPIIKASLAPTPPAPAPRTQTDVNNAAAITALAIALSQQSPH